MSDLNVALRRGSITRKRYEHVKRICKKVLTACAPSRREIQACCNVVVHRLFFLYANDMGICICEPARGEAVHLLSESGIAAGERGQYPEARQHGMSICDVKSVGCIALCGAGEGGRAAPRQVQGAGPRQHGVGICNGGCARWAAVCSTGWGGRAALG